MAARKGRRRRMTSTTEQFNPEASAGVGIGTVATQPKMSRSTTRGRVGAQSTAKSQINLHRKLVAQFGSGYWRNLCEQQDQFASS